MTRQTRRCFLILALLSTTLLVAALFAPQTLGAAKPAAGTKVAAPKVPPVNPDPARVAEITAMLPDQPQGLGRPISDRAAWEKVAKQPHFKEILRLADACLKEPVPDQPDALFLEYTKSGDRNVWQKVAFERRNRLWRLVLAECATNQGKYLEKINQYSKALCEERTWVYSAHDRSLGNFNGTIVDIDLGSSAVAWNFATADYLLGDKLDPATRAMIRENVERRSHRPFREFLEGKNRACYWATATHNWNAVCMAGTVGASLALTADKTERARFVAAAEKASEFFLSGFTPDGYCSEGLGYWNYGFGHYVLMAETIKQATGGKLDFLAHPKAKAPATFPARIQIINGVAPAFADCPVYPKPSRHPMWYLNRRFALGLGSYDILETDQAMSNRHPVGYLFEEILYRFDNTMSAVQPAASAAKPELRSWFDSAGILIARPAPGSSTKLGVALKGGHNAEHHNHNDLGSFVAVVGDGCLIIDPGPETYTGRTFSSKRYDSKLLNSFGHPVPVVAGVLQKPGGDARAKILQSEFTDATDTLAMDLTSAYPVKELKSLQRSFVYSRADAGSLVITDKVAFSAPQSFGVGLITLGKWKQAADNVLVLEDKDQGITATITASGKFAVKAEQIIEQASVKPTRIGIDLVDPAAEATITVKIEPK